MFLFILMTAYLRFGFLFTLWPDLINKNRWEKKFYDCDAVFHSIFNENQLFF